ncbi:MAG: hypothetical protein ACYS74_16135 [Planctomycetota bacterium]
MSWIDLFGTGPNCLCPYHGGMIVPGQLTWDYGVKVVVVPSEKAQGLVDFAAGHTCDFPGVGGLLGCVR